MRSPSILAALLACALLSEPALTASATGHTGPLVQELKVLLVEEYAGPLDQAGKRQLKAIEASLTAFEQAPPTTWGDLRALTRSIRRLSTAFGEDFDPVEQVEQNVSLKDLACSALDGLDADVRHGQDELQYLAPTLWPPLVSKGVARRAARAAVLQELAQQTDQLVKRARRLWRAARLVDKGQALSLHAKAEAEHFVFGPDFGTPVVADSVVAQLEQEQQRLWLRGWTLESVPAYEGQVHLSMSMGEVTGPGTYVLGGPDWSAYVEVTGPDGVTRYDAPEYSGQLVIELLDLEQGLIKAHFGFPALVPGGQSLFAVDHGSLRVASLELLP